MAKFKLTDFQLSLWFEWKLRPESTAYNLPFMYKLIGILDLSALIKSLSYLVTRYDSLRTHFEEIDDEAYQMIDKEINYQVEIIDCSSQDNESLDKLIDEKINIIFDLKKPPLFKFSILKTAYNSHFLIFNFHHIIIDDSSLKIFFNELADAYNHFSQGKAISPPDVVATINDVLAYQVNYLNSIHYQEDTHFWQDKLADALFYTPISTLTAVSATMPGFMTQEAKFSRPYELDPRIYSREQVVGGTTVRGPHI